MEAVDDGRVEVYTECPVLTFQIDVLKEIVEVYTECPVLIFLFDVLKEIVEAVDRRVEVYTKYSF